MSTKKHGHSGLHVAPGPFTKQDYAPIIIVLVGWLDQLSKAQGRNVLDVAVESARKQLPDDFAKFKIKDGDTFLKYANDLLSWIPHEEQNSKDIYDTLCTFGFVFDQAPLKEHQNPIQPGQANKPLRWLSAWMVAYAQLVGLFMDTPDSFTTESFLSFWWTTGARSYRVGEAIIPKGGYKTFNEFFARRLKPGARPIDDPDDPRTIVYPADSTFDQAFNIEDADGEINVKGVHWDIKDLLHGSEFADAFHGGLFVHVFLNTFNYHRQHAPVAGTVREARVIQGAAYLDVEVPQDTSGSLRPIRSVDPDAHDDTGYQFLQTRGLIVIDTGADGLGLVAVLPIGMAQVSGVKLSVRKGTKVAKGDEISYFHFGGSDTIVVFQKQAGLSLSDFPKQDPDLQWTPYGTKFNTPSPKHLPPWPKPDEPSRDMLPEEPLEV